MPPVGNRTVKDVQPRVTSCSSTLVFFVCRRFRGMSSICQRYPVLQCTHPYSLCVILHERTHALYEIPTQDDLEAAASTDSEVASMASSTGGASSVCSGDSSRAGHTGSDRESSLSVCSNGGDDGEEDVLLGLSLARARWVASSSSPSLGFRVENFCCCSAVRIVLRRWSYTILSMRGRMESVELACRGVYETQSRRLGRTVRCCCFFFEVI